MHTLFSALREEYCEEHDAREMMLYSLLGTLLVWLNRQCRPRRPRKIKRSESAA
jgi:AraC family transcriptional activator of pobA